MNAGGGSSILMVCTASRISVSKSPKRTWQLRREAASFSLIGLDCRPAIFTVIGWLGGPFRRNFGMRKSAGGASAIRKGLGFSDRLDSLHHQSSPLVLSTIRSVLPLYLLSPFVLPNHTSQAHFRACSQSFNRHRHPSTSPRTCTRLPGKGVLPPRPSD